jgi:hypothetical protein
MKKITAVFLLFLNLPLLTSCQGEEAKFSFTPSFETERPVVYTFTEPKPFTLPAYQYKVQEIPLKAKQAYEVLKPYLATDIVTKYETVYLGSMLLLQTKSGEYRTVYPIYAMDYNITGEQLALLAKPSKNALSALEWETEDSPYIIASLQDLYTYETATLRSRSRTFEAFVEENYHITNTNIFMATYRPCLKGYPIHRFIARGTEDQAAQNYTSFLLSPEGKIISGDIHAGYEVIKEAPIPTELVPWEKAVEAVVQYAIPDDQRFDFYKAFDLSYDIKNVEPCYIVDTNYVALPGWEITLRKLFQEKATGKIYYLDWITAVDAVTGIF